MWQFSVMLSPFYLGFLKKLLEFTPDFCYHHACEASPLRYCPSATDMRGARESTIAVKPCSQGVALPAGPCLGRRNLHDKGSKHMSSQRYSLHIHVMDENQSQMWHQPMKPLREWYQEELIIQVQEAAEEAGCRRALLYDAQETLLWQSEGSSF